MEITKKDASAFARLREGKRAQVRKTRRSLEERSRQLSEQSALLKDDIDTFKSELATVGIHDYLTGVAHVCACAPLCPVVWSMLPEELLQRVFARLPLPEIIRIRVLSKTWDKYVTGVTPGFTKLCAERNPNLFALVSKGRTLDGDNGPMVVLFDSKGERWHRFVHETNVLAPYVLMMFTGDGGLVCFVSKTRDKEMFSLNLVVFNPLTRHGRELPLCSSLDGIQLHTVQLVMDRDSKCYKVLVVGTKKQGGGGGDAVAKIFSSVTGEWSEPNLFSDLIFCCCYWGRNGKGRGMVTGKNSPLAYDCSSSTSIELNDGYPCMLERNDYEFTSDHYFRFMDDDKGVLVKDRLFVLHYNPDLSAYVVEEYQAQRCKPHWVRLKVHEGFEIYERDRHLVTRLWGCQNFLIANAYEIYDGYQPKQTLLFDLSTCEWQTILKIPEYILDNASNMFELQWDVVP